MSKIQIDNARILDPANNRDENGSIFIKNERILSISTLPKNFSPDIRIDANGKWVCPGIIDLSARFSNPGQEIKNTLAREAAAAASSGVTTVCFPPDVSPIIDTPAVVELFLKTAAESGVVRVFPIGALTRGLEGNRLAEMHTLKSAGCIAVSNASRAVANYEILRRSLEYAASTDLTVFIHAEDHFLRNKGVVNEGPISTRLGLSPIPETAETVAVSAILLLIEQTGARAHFCRLSTARAVDMIDQAKKSGLAITADVDICHLYLTENDVDGYNSNCHLIPPLRNMEDKEALIQGLVEGTIDAVCSDHQLLDVDSKTAPFSLTKPGASTIELLLPLMLDLVTRQRLSPSQAIEKITANPGDILRLPYGRLKKGEIADIIIIDPEKTWTVVATQLLSSGKDTPFDGWELQGKVSHTILNGELIYQDQK